MNLWFKRLVPRNEKRHYFDSERAYYEHVAKHGDMLDAKMMTIGVLPNSTGAGYFDYVSNEASVGNVRQQFEILSTVSGNSALGTLMELVTPYAGPGTGANATMPTVQPSSTTADFLLVGPIVGGSTGRLANASTAIPPGALCNVQRLGVCQALFDAHNTTAGHVAIQSATTAGTCLDNASAVASKTVGTVLQSVTISSGTALVWIDVCKT